MEISADCTQIMAYREDEIHAFTASDKHIVFSSVKDINVWDFSTDFVWYIPVDYTPMANFIAVSDDCLIVGQQGGAAHLCDLDTGQRLCVLECRTWDIVVIIIFDKYIIAGSTDNTACIWYITGVYHRELKGHEGGILSIAASNDYIITGSADSTARIWQLGTGLCLHVLRGHRGQIQSVTVFGDRVMTRANDCTIRVWNVDTGDCYYVLTKNWIYSAVISDGYIITGSGNHNARVWRLTTGECLRTLSGHKAWIPSVAASGGFIVTGSNDNTIRVWDLKTSNCLRILTCKARIESVGVFGNHIVADSKTGIYAWRNILTKIRVQIFTTVLHHRCGQSSPASVLGPHIVREICQWV